MELLKVSGLNKSYNDAKVINGITFDVMDSEFLSIMGPSGSGKSTLLYIMSGIESFESGSVEINGTEMACISDKERSKLFQNEVSFVFQNYNLVPYMTVRENITLPLLVAKKNIKEYQSSMNELVNLVGLDKKLEQPVNLLSGGEQQRVAIARALITNPKIIFADEPTGNLDSRNTQVVLKFFQKLNREKGVTIIMVTHSEESIQYGTSVLKLKDGMAVSKKEVLR